MRFYMTPGSCSTGIHILLEECEALFEAHIVDLRARERMAPEFLAANPRGSVPTLVLDDGSALTHFQSIAEWIAAAYPKKRLIPDDPEAAAQMRDAMNYAVEVIHGEGFTRVFVADRYASEPGERSAVERAGRAAVERGFARLRTMLPGRTYIADRFSIGDAAVFYVEFWADRIGIALPPRCQHHFEAMLERYSVRQVLGEEGYASTLRKYPAQAIGLR